jgi:site-specific DNA recombinase
MKPIVALYARVSTQRQEEEATIASQVASIEAYATSQGYIIPKELYFLDEAVSGARLDRPALDRLRDEATEGVYQAVVCLSPDRLSRQYTHQIILLEEFRQIGIQVMFVNQPPVENNPQSQLFFGIQGLFSEYERSLITERLRRGRLYAARQGRMVGPQTPYGYRYIAKDEKQAGRWEIDPQEARVVRQIYDWYTQDQPVSVFEISSRLEAQKEQLPPRHAKHWYPGTVGCILKQRQYTGQAYYNRTGNAHEEIGQPKVSGHGRRRNPGRTPRPPEEWIAIPVPAILPNDLWERAQERLAMNQKFSARNNRHHSYLLRGLLVCATCGYTLTARTSNGHVSYGCVSGSMRRATDVPAHTCLIHAEVIEPLVWQALTDLLRNPQLIAQAWNAPSVSDGSVAECGEAQRLHQRANTLDRQQERLLDLFQEEKIEKVIYLQRKERLAQERNAIQQRVLQLTNQANSEQTRQQMISDFAQHCQKIQANLTNPTQEIQQEVIRLLIDHIVVGENEIVIKHIVPTDDDCRLQPQRKYATSASSAFYFRPQETLYSPEAQEISINVRDSL